MFGTDPEEPAQCASGDKYLGSSGYRRIGSSVCKDGIDLTPKVYRICGTTMRAGQVSVSASLFNHSIDDFFYYNSTSTVVMKDQSRKVYQSVDEGQNWSPILENNAIISLMPDPHRGMKAHIIAADQTVFYSVDSGKTYNSYKLPISSDNSIIAAPLQTHPEKDSWLLYTGVVNCARGEIGCHTETFVSWDGGLSWNMICKNALKCLWGRDKKFKSTEEAAVFCQRIDDSLDPREPLVSKDKHIYKSSDPHLGISSFQLLFQSAGFAIFEQYMISLSVYYSVVLFYIDSFAKR